MLNTKEKFKILQFIRKCYTLCCFPLVVDLPSWQLLQNSATRRKRFLSWAYIGSFVLNSLYKLGTLFGACFTHENIPLHLLVIHGLLALDALFLIYWYYLLFINNPGGFSFFFRLTLTGNIGAGRTVPFTEGSEPNSSASRLKQYNLQDLAALYLPQMVALALVTFIVTYIYCPSLQALLYAGLPKQHQTWLSFVILLAEEFRYVFTFYAVFLPVWILQVMSFDLVNHQLTYLIGSIRRTANRRTVERTYSSLRHIQLYISVTNEVNRNLIFSWKILCMGICIGAGYAAIAHFSDYPIFGVMYYIILIDGAFIYMVSYDKAFKIPGLFQDAKKQTLFRLRGGGRGDMQILKRQMGSIPPVGINVGHFHVLERQSTPRFVDFVLNNIVSMLVAFKH